MTQKERYDTRKAAGLCVHCGKPARENMVTCEECAKKKNEYGKQLTKWRHELGLCTKCGKRLDCKGNLCLVCKSNGVIYNIERNKSEKEKQNQRENAKRLYAERKAEHKCVKCGRDMPKDRNKTMCVECALRRSREERERSHKTGLKRPIELRGNGKFCAICVKPVETEGAKLCDRCLASCRAKAEKMRTKVPKDNYFAKQIQYQWKCSVERRKKYEHSTDSEM